MRGMRRVQGLREGRRQMKIAKYTVLAGNYGSGKTEISLNLAVRAAAEGKIGRAHV